MTVTGSSIGAEPVVATATSTVAVPPARTGWTAESVVTEARSDWSALPYNSTSSMAKSPLVPAGRVTAYPHICVRPRTWSMPPTGW